MQAVQMRRSISEGRDIVPVRNEVYPGARIGRWTVLSKSTGDGERRWICRCECGTERDVFERSLRYGGSLSCGCLRKDNAYEAIAYDLTGQRFGRLTVIGKALASGKRGCQWRCRCDCGKEAVLAGTLLMTGKRISCGCDTVKKYAFSDISGQKFNRLTALYPLENRTVKGGLIWHCRCECGNELDVSYNNLLYTNMKSCGCKKQEHDMQLKELLPHVDGTSICHLRSKKTPKNNTTGIRGVYRIKGRYVAKIVFQKRQYFLGSYDALADAAEARREAEEQLNNQVIEFYERWKAKADAESGWAEKNPIRISVERRNGEWQVELLPMLRDDGEMGDRQCQFRSDIGSAG